MSLARTSVSLFYFLRLLRHLGGGPELNTEIRHLSRDKLQIVTTPLGLAVSTSRSLISALVPALITALVLVTIV